METASHNRPSILQPSRDPVNNVHTLNKTLKPVMLVKRHYVNICIVQFHTLRNAAMRQNTFRLSWLSTSAPAPTKSFTTSKWPPLNKIL